MRRFVPPFVGGLVACGLLMVVAPGRAEEPAAAQGSQGDSQPGAAQPAEAPSADVTAADKSADKGNDAAGATQASPAAALGTASVEKQVTGPLPGHSLHGEVFDQGPRRHAYRMSGVGRVNFPVTTEVAAAQEFFDQGVAQLHGFWYLEAERSFRQAAALDPQLAMAYWGMAMANVNNEKRAKGFIDKAVKLTSHASQRESLWIDALAKYYAAGDKDDKARRRELVRALENIIHEYPLELEAKAFLAVQIWFNSSKGLPISSHQAVEALLAEVFAAAPDHPAHHYRIHLWDKEKAARALESAARCGPAAPGIAHMWHMPGHIYSNLHRYGDAAWQQEASARVDHAHMIRDRLLPDQIHNYAHNNEWLIRDLVHVGRVRDAIALAENMIELPRHPEYNVLTKTSSSQYGRIRLFDVLERCELWDELVARCNSPYLEATDIPEQQVKRLRALAAAHFGRGEIVAGKAQIAALRERLAVAKSQQKEAAEKAEKTARDKKEPDDKVAKAKKDAENKHNGEIKRIETALADLQGRLALAAGEYSAAKDHFEKAGDLGKEYLSRAALDGGDLAKAQELAREAAEAAPGQVLPLANYVDVLHRCGKSSDAQAQFEKLRAVSAAVDIDLPVCRRLTELAAKLGLPRDWRTAAETKSDLGQRPPLDSLGPFRWHPSPAEDWTLPTADGRLLSLQDKRGRPVVVVFYLGFGCVHCVEQLQALAKLSADFATAGIDLMAVSSETLEGLRTALASRAVEAPPLPFPLLADPELGVFRLYHAFDDFENTPLHGTFLIDGQGLVRWQDIGAEPFVDLKFLLAEAQRLLSLPPR